MTATTLKKRIQKAMDNVNDESVLTEVYAMLEKAQKKPQTLKPMTLKEFYARNAQSQKDIKEGRVISQEEIKRRFGYKKCYKK